MSVLMDVWGGMEPSGGQRDPCRISPSVLACTDYFSGNGKIIKEGLGHNLCFSIYCKSYL